MADLLGTRVSAGERNCSPELWRNLLSLVAPPAAIGRKAEAALIDPGYTDADRAVLDRTVDALVSLNTVPAGAYEALAREVPLRLLPVDAATLVRFVARQPSYAGGFLAAGAYAGIDAPMPTLTTPLVMAASPARGDKEVVRL